MEEIPQFLQGPCRSFIQALLRVPIMTQDNEHVAWIFRYHDTDVGVEVPKRKKENRFVRYWKEKSKQDSGPMQVSTSNLLFSSSFIISPQMGLFSSRFPRVSFRPELPFLIGMGITLALWTRLHYVFYSACTHDIHLIFHLVL